MNNPSMLTPADLYPAIRVGILDELLEKYAEKVKKIDEVVDWYSKGHEVIGYFADGNTERGNTPPVPDRIFKRDGAIAALNSEFWSMAINSTDVLEAMPAKRRLEWNDQIFMRKAPDFIESIVKPTLIDLINGRGRFFAERVDGIFRALSGEHVTNQPQAFGKRMIVSYVINGWGSADSQRVEYISDLRAVIGRFMGREEHKHTSTGRLVEYCLRRSGEWVSADGGAFRIRVYKKGTAHIEIHPDMAWRLNCVLAELYPGAIAAPSRNPPAKPAKQFHTIETPLPFEILAAIAGARKAYKPVKDDIRGRVVEIPNSITLDYQLSKTVRGEVEKILGMLGGVRIDGHRIQFDYDPWDVLDELIVRGRIPEHKSHQFYPTPEKLAALAVDLAEIQDGDLCLEPSAGAGGIAKYLPKERTTCIEISGLFSAILESYSSKCITGDFLAVKPEEFPWGFDRIVMNPPYSEGRAKLHTEHAAKFLRNGGRLVAILPASMKNRFELPGFATEWSEIFSDEFEGTGVSVVIMVAMADQWGSAL